MAQGCLRRGAKAFTYFCSVPLAVRRSLSVFHTGGWKLAPHEPPSLPLLTAFLLAARLREGTGSVPWGSCCLRRCRSPQRRQRCTRLPPAQGE